MHEITSCDRVLGGSRVVLSAECGVNGQWSMVNGQWSMVNG
ncbi:hypothetical protein [Oscillatoria sp. FACHB-1407]|nr:hypothetical protein [Oscillatoria sp. FACHB-1407]